MLDYENETGVPSVSDVFKVWVDRRWFKPEHSDRGSKVHERVDCHLSGDFMPDWDESLKPYYDSFLTFADQRIDKVVFTEKRLVSVNWGFCGKPDIVFIDKLDGLIALGDWKTSVATAKYWPLQLGGYSILLKECEDIKVDKAIMVRLRREEGKKALVNDYNVAECERLFLNQLELFKMLGK